MGLKKYIVPLFGQFFSVFNFFYFYFWSRASLCCLGWSGVVQSWLTAAFMYRTQGMLQSLSVQSSWDYRHTYAWLIYIYFLYRWGLSVLQASINSPTLASQSVGMTGISPCTQLWNVFKCKSQWKKIHDEQNINIIKKGRSCSHVCTVEPLSSHPVFACPNIGLMGTEQAKAHPAPCSWGPCLLLPLTIVSLTLEHNQRCFVGFWNSEALFNTTFERY